MKSWNKLAQLLFVLGLLVMLLIYVLFAKSTAIQAGILLAGLLFGDALMIISLYRNAHPKN